MKLYNSMKHTRVKFEEIFVVILLAMPQLFAAPYNGGFELYDYNEFSGINEPNGWHTERLPVYSSYANYEGVVHVFIPVPLQGSTSNWRIDPVKGLAPFEGNSLLVLNSGDSSMNVASAWQSITIGEGDKLTGVYFFGACDYSPYNDFAEIKLVPKNNPLLNTILVAYADIQALGDYGSFGGWRRFAYTFNASEVGDYNLVLMVSDYIDYQLESFLAVDGLVLCPNHPGNPPPGKADFNCDCTVNFTDFAILANDWMYDCNNPIIYQDDLGRARYYDPNCNCLLGTNLNGSGPVDVNDLKILSEHWLEGIKEE
jgi:hypothetical protein